MTTAQHPPQRLVLPTNRLPARPAAHRRKPAAPRMSSENYFQAAFEILAESGAEGVTAMNMCERLGVTKGSFYYHFYSMPEFVEAFVAYWEVSVSGLMDDIREETDPLQRMPMAASVLAGMAHEAEAALRAWGHSNSVVGDAQVRIDRQGEQLLLEMIRPFVDDPDLAALHAHQMVAMIIGMQHRERPIDRERYVRALANFAELILGVRMTINEAGVGPVAEVRVAD